MLLLLTACTSHTAKTDTDTVVPDGDIPTVDGAVETEADDFIFVEADELLTDADNIDCPPLATAPFPYYKEDGTIHFCRKCDLPAKTDDPQCVRNLWEEAQKRYVAKYPEKDCYPYPCDMPNLKPMVNGDPIGRPISECDLALPPTSEFDNGMPQWKHFGVYNGVVGFMMNTSLSSSFEYPTDGKAWLYNIANNRYTIIFPSVPYTTAYANGMLASVWDYNQIKLDGDAGKAQEYLLYWNQENGYKAVYGRPLEKISYAPLIGNKWALVTLQVAGENTKRLYAKIGEWKWHTFSNDLSYIASLSGDHLGFHSTDYTGYVCDLSKLPTSPSECIKVGRPSETVFYVTMDQANEKRFAYTALNEQVTDHGIIVVGEIGADDTVTYTEHSIPFSEETVLFSAGVDHFAGNLILYSENYQRTTQSEDVKWCFYRIDTKKNYCSKFVNDTYTLHDQGKAEFEGKYVLWQSYAGYGFYLRDMDCYCEKEGVCPFEQ